MSPNRGMRFLRLFSKLFRVALAQGAVDDVGVRLGQPGGVAADIGRMQQHMGPGLARRVQEFLVEGLDARVIAAQSQRVFLIGLIERGRAQGLEVRIIADTVTLDRLAAAVDAAAGAGHDLDHLIVRLARLDFLQQLTGIGQARGDGDPDGLAAQIVGDLPDGLRPADLA